MSSPISNTNISFQFLHSSHEFLNTIINEISSCILLLDKDMKLQAFNDPLKTIFSNKPDEHLLYKRCGEVIGCAYTVEEMKDCGSTSKCSTCELRENSMLSYLNNSNLYKGKIIREFYKTNSHKALKFLQYSVRSFNFDKERYIILIIDDITPLNNVDEL
jgi:sigma-B regulation protein RsbU (phosphoserine phosphatase)